MEAQRGENYSFPLSLTSALDGGVSRTPGSGRITPGNEPVLIVQEAEWAPDPVWTVARFSSPLGFEPRSSLPSP